MMKRKNTVNLEKYRTYLFSPNILFVSQDNHKLYIYTNDRKLRHIDLKELGKKFKKYKPLQKLKKLHKKMIIHNNTLAWDLVGERNEKDFLQLDHKIWLSAPVVEKNLEELFKLGRFSTKS